MWKTLQSVDITIFYMKDKGIFSLIFFNKKSTGNFISEVVYPEPDLVDKIADYMARISMSYPHI